MLVGWLVKFKGGGPKTTIIKQYLTKQTDFLVLTEVKAKKSQVLNKRYDSWKTGQTQNISSVK